MTEEPYAVTMRGVQPGLRDQPRRRPDRRERRSRSRRPPTSTIEQQQVVDFVLDLEKCPFIDSEGLETLLWLKRRCEELFGQVKLASLTRTAARSWRSRGWTSASSAMTDLAVGAEERCR